MIKAYILTKCNSPVSVSSLTDLLTEVRKIKGVKQAHAIHGPHDGIVYVEVEDYDQMMDTLGDLLKTEGIDSTDTRIAWPR